MLKLGSRGSPLAMTQSSHTVAAQLAKATGEPESPIQAFVTSGDRIADRRLQDAGGKGLFTKELDEALLDKRIDAAIHSLKDLPTLMPDGIVLAAIPSREDPRDAFIARSAPDLMALPEGAVIGTASLRRQAQTLHLRPDTKSSPCAAKHRGRGLSRMGDGVMRRHLSGAGGPGPGWVCSITPPLLIDVEDMPPGLGPGRAGHHLPRRRDAKTREILARMRPCPAWRSRWRRNAAFSTLLTVFRWLHAHRGAGADRRRPSSRFLGEVLMRGRRQTLAALKTASC